MRQCAHISRYESLTKQNLEFWKDQLELSFEILGQILKHYKYNGDIKVITFIFLQCHSLFI